MLLMRDSYRHEFQRLNSLIRTTGRVEISELESGSYIEVAGISYDEIALILEENDFEYVLCEDGIFVEDSFEELMEEFDEYDFKTQVVLIDHPIRDLPALYILEGTAKRKVVVRRGKRKVIYKCAPGQHKVGRNRCVKTASGTLMKMKRRAKRAAKKSKRKRSQANRRRKVSMRRRPHRPKHKK